MPHPKPKLLSKIVLSAALLVAVLAGAGGIINPTTAQAAGEVGIWHFDEGSGTIAADSSGNDNDGTIYGATWTDGKDNDGLSFDGIDDYVKTANNANFLSAEGSIEIWINPSVSRNQYFFGFVKVAFADYINLEQIYQKIRVRQELNNSFVTYLDTTDNVLVINSWNHIVVTQDGSGIKIYVNGSSVTATGTDSTNWTSAFDTTGTYIGQGLAGNMFNGSIDEAYVYNRALTASEIVANYQAGISTISGIVTSSGVPVSGATITVGARSTVSGILGDYMIPNISAGSYSVTASAAGYQNFTEADVMVINGQATIVNFSLFPSSIVPDIYDDFSDGKYQNRTGIDPWGRSLPNWTVESGTFDASNGYMVPTSLGYANHANFSTPTDILKGTWVFRYKYLNGTPVFSGNDYTLEITAQYNNPSGIGVYKGLGLKNPVDGHWWLDYPYSNGHVTRNGYIVNMAGSQIDKSLVGGSVWHEVVFIKDQNDYIYSWLDGKFVRWSTDQVYDVTDSTKFFFNFYDGTYNLQYPIAIDDVRVYRDKYLPPTNAVVYDSASGNIIIKGWGATLSSIAATINNPAIFSYSPSTNTATAYKDILVDRGSELKIENGTLLMASTYDGERKIKYYTDAIFNIINSTIDSANSYYYLWQRLSDGDSNLKNTFRVVNSTINNTGEIFLERPVAFYIENSNFTNLVGSYPIDVYFRWPQRELKIMNSKFVGKTGTEKMRFNGGDQFNQLSPKHVGWNIIDSDLSQIIFECVQDSTYYLSPLNTPCTANLINIKLGTPTYSGTTLRNKYYLDVKVVDSNNNPVNGANIAVLNEQDDVNYPAENLSEGKDYFQLINQKAPDGSAYFSGQTSNWIKGWTDVNDYRAAVTGADGHTPLPSNTANTLVITQKETKDSGATAFTYKITAVYNGKTATVTGVNPDETWHRTNPNAFVKTVNCNIDSGVCSLGAPSSDTTLPAISISSPTNNATVSNPSITATGAASDNIALSKVEVKLNSGSYQTATGTTNWSIPLTLVSGSNTITAKATDTSNNTKETSITVTYTPADTTPTPTPPSTPPSGGGGGDSSDTVPPIISNVSSSFIAANSAIVSWDTNELSNSQVEYGLSSKYGFQTGLFPNLINYHVIKLSNLSSTIVYHYRVISTDASGNKTVSGDKTFTTLAGGNPDLNNIPIPPSATSYPEGTLFKIPESFKVYVIISQKKKWIPTPEVFETLGYQWTAITIVDKTDLGKIPDYEDNLIRAVNDYKVYLVVNGIKRHIPNPEIFLDYGFSWDDVKDVPAETINKYSRGYLIRESRQGDIFYLSPNGVKKWIPNPEIFSSYNNRWEDIQVVSKKEMDSYPESNLRRYNNQIFLIENNAKRLIPNETVLNRYDVSLILDVNKDEFDWWKTGANVK